LHFFQNFKICQAYDTPKFFDAVDYHGIHGFCVTIGSSLLLVGFVAFSLISLRCLSGQFLIYLIIWTCIMIVAELMYFTFSLGTWNHVKPWLNSMYIGYSDRTATPIYHVDRLSDRLNDENYNVTIIARSKFVDQFHDEFQCCGWSSRFDIPNRYFWSANHCQIDLDDYGVRYLPTCQEKLFNVRFIFNSSILSLVLIKCWFLIAAWYNLYFASVLKYQESKEKSVVTKSADENVKVSKAVQKKHIV